MLLTMEKAFFTPGLPSFGAITGNLIRRNSILLNSELGIDLGVQGVTLNDSCDTDTGANNLQNRPVLASVLSNGIATNIIGSLNSTASTAFAIDFFVSPAYDSTNFGEGKTYMGSTNVTTASNCSVDFNVTIQYPAAGNQFVTATVTDSSGNTSEFSQYIRADGASVRKVNYDFDGDGKSDLSVFRPSSGIWFLSRLNANIGYSSVQFGQVSDKLAPADYDGDGKTYVTVYRAGTWFVQRSRLGLTSIQYGASDDIPVPADYDADRKNDLAVYRPSNGTWYVFNQITGQYGSQQWGLLTDKPVVADYDGDGRADYAVFRPSNGTWYLLRSRDGFSSAQWGEATVLPVQADYDGRTHIGVFRPSNGTWYLLNSTEGFAAVQFGDTADRPIPNAIVP